MKRKIYLKPDARYVLFYSDEELTLSLEEGMQGEGDGTGSGNGVSTNEDLTDKPQGWE